MWVFKMVKTVGKTIVIYQIVNINQINNLSVKNFCYARTHLILSHMTTILQSLVYQINLNRH